MIIIIILLLLMMMTMIMTIMMNARFSALCRLFICVFKVVFFFIILGVIYCCFILSIQIHSNRKKQKNNIDHYDNDNVYVYLCSILIITIVIIIIVECLFHLIRLVSVVVQLYLFKCLFV